MGDGQIGLEDSTGPVYVFVFVFVYSPPSGGAHTLGALTPIRLVYTILTLGGTLTSLPFRRVTVAAI
jgi:hypothetical protein